LPYLDLGQVESAWGNLENCLLEMGTKAIIRSSSEDVPEQNVEELVSAAAKQVGVPVFVVEDFPGNYWPKPVHRIDGLFVEDESLIELYKSRGIDPQIVYNSGNPRYSKLASLDAPSRRVKVREDLGLGDDRVMLWAGQPDGDNSYWALERLLKRFGKGAVTLLFRAHPRDAAYTTGKYGELFSRVSMKVLDTSAYPDALDLYCASDLVITQFSSAGVEASYLGVPALFVLFDDLGKQYLRTFKGYDTLPWYHESCAFLLEQESEVERVLAQALFDRSSREEVCANFQRRFGARTDSASVISHRIQAVLGGGI